MVGLYSMMREAEVGRHNHCLGYPRAEVRNCELKEVWTKKGFCHRERTWPWMSMRSMDSLQETEHGWTAQWELLARSKNASLALCYPTSDTETQELRFTLLTSDQGEGTLREIQTSLPNLEDFHGKGEYPQAGTVMLTTPQTCQLQLTAGKVKKKSIHPER